MRGSSGSEVVLLWRMRASYNNFNYSSFFMNISEEADNDAHASLKPFLPSIGASASRHRWEALWSVL